MAAGRDGAGGGSEDADHGRVRDGPLGSEVDDVAYADNRPFGGHGHYDGA